MNSIWNPSRL
ncbi:unnamed protein product [Timema podura]|uniref:Uncharacterized protein n=1 Tax=Timema podura TaxID=61482 RepID=A0ABN7PAR8_TIMPD|nr:unnamed protein product [Timema podura]